MTSVGQVGHLQDKERTTAAAVARSSTRWRGPQTGRAGLTRVHGLWSIQQRSTDISR